MEWNFLLLSTVSVSTRVFGACLAVGCLCNVVLTHLDRSSKRLSPSLDLTLRILALVSILGAVVFLFFQPFD